MSGQDKLPSYVPKGGSSYNGRGRPAQANTFATLIERELGKVYRNPDDDEDPPNLTYKEKMVRTAIRQAAHGNLNALIELINRTEGKVPDRAQIDVEHTYKVVPWDDDDAPGFEYVENLNLSDRPDAGDPRALPPPDATPKPGPGHFSVRGSRRGKDIDLYPELNAQQTPDE